MYKITLLALSCLSLIPAEEDFSIAHKAPKTEYIQTEILIGKINRQELTEGDFGKWFEPRYDAYEVNEKAIKELSSMLKDVDITIFMGTWCGDSKRETPNAYKIFDAANVSDDQINLIAVDYNKTTPKGLENGLDIQRVPTIIFEKDGKELGRIVEYPIESLENDMLKILKGEDYKHAYAE